MITLNELIVNGKSTADFSFDVYVTRNAGYNYAKKKNMLFENTYGTGAIKNEVNAYPPIEKVYTIHCPFATLQDMREITTWASDSGTLIPSDEPDVYYEILDVYITDARIHEVTGYLIDVIFTTMPFGYEHGQSLRRFIGGESLYNHTNAPMYPRIDVFGTSGSEVQINIGGQIIKLRELNQKVTIESKPLEQNVYDKDGKIANGIMSGDFIEIKEGSTNLVTLSNGINRIEMLERWAWR